MKRCRFISHQGVDIYYIDFSDLKTVEEIDGVMIESKTFIRAQAMKSMFNLANIQNMHFNGKIKDLFVEFISGNADHVYQSAIVGVDGIRRIVFNAVLRLTGRDVRCHDSVEAALNWLAELKESVVTTE